MILLQIFLLTTHVFSYNSLTGEGALGVEFAGTAVSSTSTFGAGISPEDADKISAKLVVAGGNDDLQWGEGSYRGFFTIAMTAKELNATYWAMRYLSK